MQPTGAGWLRASGLWLLAALAGCQPDRPKERQPRATIQPPAPAVVAETRAVEPAAAKVPADTLPPYTLATGPDWRASKSAWRVLSSPAQRRILQVHRYVGTVGGQPATAELQWYTPDSISGRFYLHQSDSEYAFANAKKELGAIIFDFAEAGQWRLLNQLGRAVLRATWQQGRRQRAVALRESYTGAVRYGLRSMALGEVADSTAGPAAELRASVACDFLTLPAPAAVSPVLRHRLNPGPKTRLRQLDNLMEGNSTVSDNLEVRLNGFGLFSYQIRHYAHETGGTSDVVFKSTLLDLTTGRPLSVASQLRPHYELPLRQLLTRRILHGTDEQDRQRLVDDWESPTLANFPDEGMGLTATGLEVIYWQPMYPAIIAIPYRELRPLVRPGTPLARMLAARKIW